MNTIYVDVGDGERVRALLEESGFDVSGLAFLEKNFNGGPYIEKIDSIEWTYKIKDDKAQVGTDFLGRAVPIDTTGVIAIPSMLGGCPVTSVGDSAFSGCWRITSVLIPEGVISIGEGAFENCSGLTSVTIPEGVTSIGDYAFQWCSGLKSVTIPSSVTNIGWRAFYRCGGLKTVHVSSGDTERVRNLLTASGFSEGGVEFVETDTTWSTKPKVEPYFVAAATYDGMIQNEDGVLIGTIQVKVAKGKTDKKTGAFSAKVTATVQLADGSRKISFKNGVADEYGNVTGLTAAGHALSVSLGASGMAGTMDGNSVDGARNVFSAKDADSKATAAAIEKQWVGAVNVVGDGVVLSVTVAKKGKVKVSGAVDGVKVSATSQLLVGETDCCIPVVITKKAKVAFNLWLGADGSVEVAGLAGATAGKAGTLKSGAAFRMDGAALAQALPGLYGDYLPGGLSVTQSGT